MHRVGVRQRVAHERVTALVVRDHALLDVGDEPAAPLGSGHHAVDRLFELVHADLVETAPAGEQRGFVHEVREIGAGEARRATRDDREVDTVRERLAARVHRQDRLAAFEIGTVDDDLAIEATRPEQRRIEDVRTVRRREQDHAGLRVEAVHLHEQLVQRLLPLVVTTADAAATMAADRVDLVHEHDRRCRGLRLREEVADPRRADSRRTSRRSPSR